VRLWTSKKVKKMKEAIDGSLRGGREAATLTGGVGKRDLKNEA